MNTTATIQKPNDAPPTLFEAYVDRVRHPATRKGTVVATLATLALLGGLAFGLEYRGYRRGLRAAEHEETV